MAATAVTLNDVEGHSPVVGLFKCNPSNTYAAFYTILTDNVLARSLVSALAELLVWGGIARCPLNTPVLMVHFWIWATPSSQTPFQ